MSSQLMRRAVQALMTEFVIFWIVLATFAVLGTFWRSPSATSYVLQSVMWKFLQVSHLLGFGQVKAVSRFGSFGGAVWVFCLMRSSGVAERG